MQWHRTEPHGADVLLFQCAAAAISALTSIGKGLAKSLRAYQVPTALTALPSARVERPFSIASH